MANTALIKPKQLELVLNCLAKSSSLTQKCFSSNTLLVKKSLSLNYLWNQGATGWTWTGDKPRRVRVRVSTTFKSTQVSSNTSSSLLGSVKQNWKHVINANDLFYNWGNQTDIKTIDFVNQLLFRMFFKEWQVKILMAKVAAPVKVIKCLSFKDCHCNVTCNFSFKSWQKV